jgi:hypothetical protein
MVRNVGNIDRIIRLILGLAIIGLGLYFGSWWGAFGLIFLFTAAVGWCPLYVPFGLSTCPAKLTDA